MKRRIWKAAKIALLSLLGLVLLVTGGGLAYRAYRHSQIARATAIDQATGIDEALFARIGGIEQFVVIRGQDRRNPVLLILHGGPGFAQSAIPRDFLFGWTRDFTLVEWDQRGAGKTFGKSGPLSPGVTIERMALDGVEVAEFVREKLRKPKIVLVGLSWGSILGVHMVKARPDLFYAYIGTGQIVNQHKYKAVAYTQLLAEAHARGDRQAIKELEANGPPPYDSFSKATVHTKWANAYEPGQPSMRSAISMVLFESEAGPLELRDYVKGLMASEDYFRDQGEAVDLPSLGPDFAIPVFVFQGALDNVAPVPPVRTYVDSITAPRKELVLIPGAGHNAIATKSDEFLTLLIQRVRPLAAP
jgi:pimeloyl-ACP methyl ester carboxylesterase